MKDKQLEWADLAYFSRGLLSVSDTQPTSITINRNISPAEFIGELLAAGTKAEQTLNAVSPPEERASNFPGARETPPVFNDSQQVYTKTVSYAFAHDVILSKQEVEG